MLMTQTKPKSSTPVKLMKIGGIIAVIGIVGAGVSWFHSFSSIAKQNAQVQKQVEAQQAQIAKQSAQVQQQVQAQQATAPVTPTTTTAPTTTTNQLTSTSLPSVTAQLNDMLHYGFQNQAPRNILDQIAQQIKKNDMPAINKAMPAYKKQGGSAYIDLESVQSLANTFISNPSSYNLSRLGTQAGATIQLIEYGN